jgi:hypothetical protein
MRFSIASIAAVLHVAAAAAPKASASIAEHTTTKQRELWGSGWYKWMPKEPEECYDVRKMLACSSTLVVSLLAHSLNSL